MDNQLPLTPMPVLFRPHRVGEENDYIFKFSLTMQSNGSLDLYVYPYIGVIVSIYHLNFLQKYDTLFHLSNNYVYIDCF